MTVQEIIDKVINANYLIEDHWHSGIIYRYDNEIAIRKVEALLIRDNTLIISI